MGDLEQVYGEAKAAAKKSARKQNLWTLGITGLGVGAAYKNLQERKKAATRMEDFQLSMRPMLHQKKELFKNGFDFWENHYAMNKKYNITKDKDYTFALRQIARKEVLAKFEYDKEDWEEIELNEQSEIQYSKNLEIYEKNKKLYSEFKPYQSAYDKTEGEKIYLSPIKKQIKYVEKNIASNSSLGSRLLTALDLKGDPELEDISVTGARGKVNFIKLPKGYKAKENLITAIETSKNKLGQSDNIKSLYVLDSRLLDPEFINGLMTGGNAVSGLAKVNLDAQANRKIYQEYHDNSFNGFDTEGNPVEQYLQILNDKDNPLTTAGRGQTKGLKSFDQSEYYIAAYQTVLNNLFIDANVPDITGRDFLATLSSNADVKTLAEIMVSKASNTLTQLSDTERTQQLLAQSFTFTKGQSTAQKTLGDFADASISDIKKLLNNQNLDFSTRSAKLKLVNDIIRSDKKANQALFLKYPEIETAYNNYLNKYLEELIPPQLNRYTGDPIN